MASPSPLFMKYHDRYEQTRAQYGGRRLPDFTQASNESDQNLTARSTRFGNGKVRVQSRISRETPSVLSTPPYRVSSETARALEKVLPKAVLPSPTKTEPELPRYPITRNANSKPLVQNHADMPICLPGKSEAQPTATLPLPEVPNLTELVAGVYDNSTPIFDTKKYQASRFAWAYQAGENTDRVSLPDADEATPKYDQKKLLASIRSLENKVAELQHQQAESEHTIQYLRQKAFEAESKGRSAGRRSDSALGSVSGGSDAGEDKSGVEYRNLMIEKNRIMARNNTLNEIALVYQENLKTVTQERESAVAQLGTAYYTNEQLKMQNKDLEAEVLELRGNVAELIAYQEESSIGFEADPDMTAKDAECDRIMAQREQADNTRQRIKASLRARREQVTEPIPDLPPCIFPISHNHQDSQPASTANEEPKVTIDDVSLDLSYQSNVPGTATGVRQDLEVHKFDEEPAQVSVCQEESALSRSQLTTPDRWAISSIHSPENQGTPCIFPKLKGSYRDDRSDMTSAWIVPDITIDFPEPKEPSVPQVSDTKGEVSGGEQSDDSKSTVERVLHQSREAQHSPLDENSKAPAERSSGQIRAPQPSLLDDRSNSIMESNGQNKAIRRSLIDGSELSIGQTPATQHSLLDYNIQPTGERSIDQTRTKQRSLLDDDSQSSVGHSSTALRIKDSLLIAKRNICKDQPALPSLLDYDSKSVVVANEAQQIPKRTKVVRRPVPVSDRMPVPGPYEEEPTIRPSQHPGIALATVLTALESELSELKRSAKKYQKLYDDHDAALSKRSRKSVFERLQKLNQSIDIKADHIYSLYDVLEGQKQCGQEMSQEEVEVTLQSIGIDPEEISWDGSEPTGTHSTSSSRRA